MTLDRFTKAMLIVIAVLLGMIAFRPIVHPAPVQAQASEAYPFYLEPGYTMLRKPDGTSQVYGKVVVDMRNGDIWGFPTTVQGPYPSTTPRPCRPSRIPCTWGNSCSAKRTQANSRVTLRARGSVYNLLRRDSTSMKIASWILLAAVLSVPLCIVPMPALRCRQRTH